MERADPIISSIDDDVDEDELLLWLIVRGEGHIR